MKKIGVVGTIGVWSISVLLSLPARQAEAQENSPSTDEECFNDHAEVLGKGDRSTIKKLCRKASKENVNLMVVTVGSLDDFRPRPLSVDRFVDTIFEDWDTGYEEGKDAVLLFVSIKENEFRVVVGDNYTDKLRNRASGIIRGTLVPDFRRRKKSRGIRKAYSRLYKEVVAPHIVALKKAAKRKPGPGVMQGP